MEEEIIYNTFQTKSKEEFKRFIRDPHNKTSVLSIIKCMDMYKNNKCFVIALLECYSFDLSFSSNEKYIFCHILYKNYIDLFHKIIPKEYITCYNLCNLCAMLETDHLRFV